MSSEIHPERPDISRVTPPVLFKSPIDRSFLPRLGTVDIKQYQSPLQEKEVENQVLLAHPNLETLMEKDRVVRVLFNELFDHSPYTAEHTAQVTETTVALARTNPTVTSPLSGRELVVLGRAAILHDIGKLAVRKAALDLPAELLTDDDKLQLKRHVITSVCILAYQYEGSIDISKEELEEMTQIILSHHELQGDRSYDRREVRYDDPRLYEKRLMLAIADSLDAQYANRPYYPQDRVQPTREELFNSLTQQFPDVDVNLIHVALDTRLGIAE